MRRSLASTSPSEILTAHTPAQTGTAARTSTSSGASSTSGSTAPRSCAEESSCLIPSLRRQFNEAFRPEKYERFLKLIEQRVGMPVKFRLSETPVFLPRDLIDRMVQYGAEMVGSLLDSAEYLRVADTQAIPAAFRVPN